MIQEIEFAPDSPLEGDGFELPVPGREAVKPSCETVSKTGADLLGNRRFESISLQRRVRCEPDWPKADLPAPVHRHSFRPLRCLRSLEPFVHNGRIER